MSKPIGIDLGTTYSCIAYYDDDGKAQVIPNSRGHRITPSCVAFTDRQRLIGDAAMDQAAYNAKNTVFCAKRLIGRKFHSSKVQADKKLFPFEIVNHLGNTQIEVQYKKRTTKFAPEQISAMVLEELKTDAEKFLGTKVRDVVITVPAYFNDAQRRATKDAGSIAGLNVLRIINEPTAAALAYGVDKNVEETVLVFDLGGGTLDVSILKISGNNIDVKAVSGNNHLGGEDFTNCLVEYLAGEFGKKRASISSNSRAMRRLRGVCDKVKVALSSSLSQRYELDSLDGDNDFDGEISRPKFESLCDNLFNDILKPVQDALKDANMAKGDINRILMVGGSSRIPKVQEILKTFFDGKDLSFQINPDEAVACGAAILAAECGSDGFAASELSVHDVTPFSLGIQVYGGLFSVVIPRNTSVPATLSKEFSTVHDNQTGVCFSVYEGEREIAHENSLLGKFNLNGLPPLPRKQASANLTCCIDVNGILTITAVDASNSGNKNSITITNDNSHLSKDEVKRMIKAAKRFREVDNKEVRRINAKLRLEDSVYTLKKVIAYKCAANKDYPKLAACIARMERHLEKDFCYLKDYQQWQSQLETAAKPVSRHWKPPKNKVY